MHMREHMDRFLNSLTPEEREIHNRPDVKAAEKDVVKMYKKEVRKAWKGAK